MTRKRRGRAEWAQLVQLWKSSGQTAKVFAAERGLAPASLYWWSQQVKRDPVTAETMSFVPVEITPSSNTSIALEFAEVRMQVPVGADITYVMSLLAALRVDKTPC